MRELNIKLAKSFEIDFFLEYDLEKINSYLKTRNTYDYYYNRYVFGLKPFLGRITVNVDKKNILEPEKLPFSLINS